MPILLDARRIAVTITRYMITDNTALAIGNARNNKHLKSLTIFRNNREKLVDL